MTRKKSSVSKRNSSQVKAAAEKEKQEKEQLRIRGEKRREERAAKELARKNDKQIKQLHALAADMGVEIGAGEEKSSQASNKSIGEGNSSLHDETPIGLGSFSTRMQDAKVTAFKCDPYPGQGNFRPYVLASTML